MKKKFSIYPEARNQTSQYLTNNSGSRTLPKELYPSQTYKDSVTSSIKARLQALQNPVQGDIDTQLALKELEDVKHARAYEEAMRLRGLQTKMDGNNLPLHMKGKINAADSMIQELGFEKIPHISGKPPKVPTSAFSYMQKIGKRVVPGLAIAGGLAASDMASAAADFAVPGGVEDMGVSDEQRALDKRYHEVLKQRSLRGKN